MSDSDYEYRGLVAAGWDFLRGEPSDFHDGPFFRDLIRRSGEPALDVGCGTGRLLLAYAAEGVDVDGVDNSPEMLAICREKAADWGLTVSVYEQAIEALELPRRYRTIIVPSSTFQLLPDLADARRALDGFYRALLPGGLLAMSLWHILSEGSEAWGDWWLVAEREGFRDGRALRRWERSRYDAATGLRHTENRYELLEDGEVVYEEKHRRSPALRNYGPARLSGLLEAAGFADVRAVAGYSDDPAGEEDAAYCIMGTRK